MDLNIRVKFRGRRPTASYFSHGSLVKKPSVKYASRAILVHIYLDESARYSRPAFIVRYNRIRSIIVLSFVCIANTVAKLPARRLGRNRYRPIVAWFAKLLSLNAEIVSRLNFFLP